jgi:hypothetical protein
MEVEIRGVKASLSELIPVHGDKKIRRSSRDRGGEKRGPPDNLLEMTSAIF